MAIAYDNSKTYNYNSGGTSTSYTCSALPGTVLLAVTTDRVSACTYNGVALTKVVDFSPSITDGNQVHINVFRLSNPASGSNTFDLTQVGDGNCVLVSYTGVDTNIYQPVGFATGFSNNGLINTLVVSLSTSVTTTVDRSWSVLLTHGSNAAVLFATGGGTLRATGNSFLGDGTGGIYDSNGMITPAGSSTLTSTWASGSGFISNVVLYLTEAPSGGLLNFFQRRK